jgi:subtilisin family serine protease
MKKAKVLLAAYALGALLNNTAPALAMVSASHAAAGARPEFREGELIVKYRGGVPRPLSAIQNTYARINVVNVQRFESALFKDFESLQIDTGNISLNQALTDLERDPSVEYVQPNYMLYTHKEMPMEAESAREPQEAAEVRNSGSIGLSDRGLASVDARPVASVDPAIAAVAPQAGAPDPALPNAWGIAKTGAKQAWSRQRGSKNIIVAVIDTGVDYNHPDLAANIWRNPNASRTRATGVDGQGLAIAGDIVGWDFVQNDNLPYDWGGHGTHVAGSIGAVGNNGVGVSGINQRVSIMSVRFMDASGRGDTSAAIKAIDYAISRGAKVLNNSWGGKGGYNRALHDAIARSERAGALFVTSAGNDGTNNDRNPSYPAAFTDLPNVISVAATTSTDGLASFSNYGAKSVHVGAPGVSIYSTRPGNKYAYLSGTSMASPHVAGAAALLWAQNPNAGYAEIKRRLINSGDVVSSLQGRTITGRRINVLKALDYK